MKIACNMKVLITGSTGLIGAALCDALKGKAEVIRAVRLLPTPSSLPPTPYSLPPTPYPLLPTLSSLPPTPSSLPPTPYSLPPTPSSLPPTPYSLPPTPSVAYDATKPVEFDFGVDVIVHAASPASPDLFVAKPVETLMANVYGLQQLLEYARRCGAKKVVYVSSSEVYGRVPPREDGFIESDYGFVDVLSPRSSYPMGKRAAETLCAAYVAQYGLEVSIVRPGHIYGPTCSEKDKRVSSAFPWLAARGLPIVMKSDGAQIRSYTHADDCARAIMAVIESGKPGEAYNIAARCGKCSIRQMAEIVAKAGGVELKVELPSGVEAAAFNPMNNSCLDPSKLEALGWRGEITPEQGFTETVQKLKEKIK